MANKTISNERIIAELISCDTRLEACKNLNITPDTLYKRMKEEGLKSKMILQVHDELNFSVLPEEKERLQNLVIEEMQGAANLSVPLIADCGWGSNWLEAH